MPSTRIWSSAKINNHNMCRRYFLVELFLLFVYFSNSGLAVYQWACTGQDGDGKRYVPNVRDRDVVTVGTAGDQLNVYLLSQNLSEACYGRIVEIEYCYRYNTTMTGPAVFKWTVLILREQSMSQSAFTITDRIVIESHSNSANCIKVGMCCDVTRVSRNLNLSRNFVFGVTGPSQGNTHSATLLGFHDTVTQYLVNTILLSSGALSLSVGSTIPSIPAVQKGLRMLWFVIGTGDHESAVTTETTNTSIKESVPSTSTLVPTSHGVTTEMGATVDNKPPSVVNVTIGSVFGGIFVSFLLLMLFLLLLLLVWLKRKYKRVLQENEAYQLQQVREEGSSHETTDVMGQRSSELVDQTIKMDGNEAYCSAVLQIKTEDNVAYVCFDNAHMNEEADYDYV